MKHPLIIAGIAGMLSSLAVPLPHDEPVSRGAVQQAGPAPGRKARPAPVVAEPDWPVDTAFISRLSANECGAALDRILRHCACTLPDGETLDAAVALTMRLTDLSAAVNPERNPLRGRQLPSWLIEKVTDSWLNRPLALPAGWMTAVGQSAAGRDAMKKLTAELAVSSPDKAKSLAAACPAPWRPALNAKVREGLAVRDPVAAAREAWEAAAPFSETAELVGNSRPARMLFEGRLSSGETPKDNRQEMLMISSRKGPVKEAVTALALYGEGEVSDPHQQQMLANLLQRDPAGTRAAVEENGDPVLQKQLAKAEQGPVENDDRPLSWGGLPPPAIAAGSDTALRMAAADPAKAFQWAKANSPGELSSIFNTWVQADGPAALQAVWSLPPENRLREWVEGIARTPGDTPHFGGTWMDIPQAEIRSAARYVKLPEDPAPQTFTPRESNRESPLWSDGPTPRK